MRIIDERSKMDGIAERWKQQYLRRDGWFRTVTGDSGEIYNKLTALDPNTATAKDVAAIIGNDSWAGPSACHECGNAAERTVEVGQPPDYDSHTAQLCRGCVAKALELMDALAPTVTGDV